MNVVPALDLSNLVIEALNSSYNQTRVRRSPLHDTNYEKLTKNQFNTSEIFGSTDVDHVIPNAKLSCHNALLYMFEDSEVVIKMIITGRSPTESNTSTPETNSHTF